jgi:hypothetical protein
VAKKAAEVVAVKPVKSLGSRATSAKDPEKMPIEAWAKMRNEQLAAKRR